MAGPRAASAAGARTRCRQALSGWTRRCSVKPSTNLESKHMRSACLRQSRAGTLGTRGARRDHPPPVQRNTQMLGPIYLGWGFRERLRDWHRTGAFSV